MLDNISNVPLRLRPIIYPLWWLHAGVIIFFHTILRATCRIEIRGLENLAASDQVIFCGWHEVAIPLMVSIRRFGHGKKVAPMISQAWHHKPLHLVFAYLGMHIVPCRESSTTGIEVADTIIKLMKNESYSTLIAPDGPKGPRRRLRKGVLLIAVETGAAIIPMRVYVSRAWIWGRSWDQKQVPLPFSKVIVDYGKPLHVGMDSLNEDSKKLRDELNYDLSPKSA